jgi:hypothetical protein
VPFRNTCPMPYLFSEACHKARKNDGGGLKFNLNPNSKNNILNKFGYLTEKLGTHKKQNIAHLTNHNNHHTTLNQIQAHSNPELHIEIERQKCNGYYTQISQNSDRKILVQQPTPFSATSLNNFTSLASSTSSKE